MSEIPFFDIKRLKNVTDIVIVGRHRSGKTCLAKFLEKTNQRLIDETKLSNQDRNNQVAGFFNHRYLANIIGQYSEEVYDRTFVIHDDPFIRISCPEPKHHVCITTNQDMIKHSRDTTYFIFPEMYMYQRAKQFKVVGHYPTLRDYSKAVDTLKDHECLVFDDHQVFKFETSQCVKQFKLGNMFYKSNF
jgi:hypothetical protein